MHRACRLEWRTAAADRQHHQHLQRLRLVNPITILINFRLFDAAVGACSQEHCTSVLHVHPATVPEGRAARTWVPRPMATPSANCSQALRAAADQPNLPRGFRAAPADGRCAAVRTRRSAAGLQVCGVGGSCNLHAASVRWIDLRQRAHTAAVLICTESRSKSNSAVCSAGSGRCSLVATTDPRCRLRCCWQRGLQIDASLCRRRS